MRASPPESSSDSRFRFTAPKEKQHRVLKGKGITERQVSVIHQPPSDIHRVGLNTGARVWRQGFTHGADETCFGFVLVVDWCRQITSLSLSFQIAGISITIKPNLQKTTVAVEFQPTCDIEEQT